jgi:hypothetical protein
MDIDVQDSRSIGHDEDSRSTKHQRLDDGDDISIVGQRTAGIMPIQNYRFEEPSALDLNQNGLFRRIVKITLSNLMGEDTKQSNRSYIDV